MVDDFVVTEEVCAEFLKDQEPLFNEAAREDPSASIFDSMEAIMGEFDKKDSDGESINDVFRKMMRR
jgi:phosphoenolpyruvate synthase/pyruvate phosphate dikinase